MCVQYKGGTQYLCNHLKQQTGAPVCQRIPADRIADQVVSWFFEAMSVADIDMAAEALKSADTEYEQVLAACRSRFARQLGRPRPRLTLANILEIQRYDWPGNVRELQHALERACIVAVDGKLRFDFPEASPNAGGPQAK